MRHLWVVALVMVLGLGIQTRGVAAEKIVLLGDSTVETFAEDREIRGWGQMIGEFIPDADIVNFARSGASSLSFQSLPQYEQAKQEGGDYWFIQFGHNDAPSKGPERATDPQTTYKENLKILLEAAREAGAEPVLITMPFRRKFDANGQLTREQQPYVDAMKELGEAEGVPVLDLYEKSGEVFQSLGPVDGAYLIMPNDITHFTQEGARLMASIIAKELKAKVPALADKVVISE